MRHFNASNNNQGFTLLEATIVIVIITILFAFAAPSYLAWSQRKKVDSAISSIEGAMKESQRRAMSMSRTCSITFNTGSNPPTITATSGTNSCLITGDRTLTGVTIAASATSVNFNYLGNSSREITVVVTPAGNPNFKKCLVLSTPLGLIGTGKYSGSGTSSANCTQ